MTDVHVSLLGPVEVTVGSQRLRLSGQKRVGVLALLALRPGQVVSADALIDALWGYDPPPGAANTLQSHVSHLRRALGPAGVLVVSRPPGYVLDLPSSHVDVHRFDDLVGRGRAALSAGRPAEADEALGAALSLWRGPALADLAGVEFAEREAMRLAETRLTAVEERTEAELALGRHHQLVAGLSDLLAAHPLRERLAGHLMLALYRCDRQAEALQVFQDTRRRLGEELGIEPSRALQALEEAILLQKPELDLAVDHVRAVEGPATLAPARSAVDPLPPAVARLRQRGELVGRTELVDEVTRLITEGHPPLVVVTGEPGIGKSRFAAELAHRAASSGALVLYGRCDRDGGAPYHPISEALADLARRHDGSAAALAAVEEQAAFLLGASGSADPGTGPTDRGRAFDEVAQAVVDAAAGARLVLLVDDLHWVDRATTTLLRHVVLGRWADSFVVVATCRSTDERPPWLTSFLEHAAGDEQLVPVELDALPVAAVAELAASLALEADPEALRSATGGNPLLIRQLSRTPTPSEGGSRRWGSLALVLENRIAALSPAVQAVLEVAALAGTQFRLGVVAAAADVSSLDALELVDRARQARLIDDVDGADRLAFVHDVVREFLVERIPPARRLRLHAALGAALERSSGEASAIAHHHLAAAPVLGNGPAASRVSDAGDGAMRRLAFEDAVALYRAAVDLLEASPASDDDQWAGTTLKLAAALFDAGDPPGARAAVLRVADAARRRGDAIRLAEAAIAYQGRWIPTAAGLDDNHRSLLLDARSLLDEDEVPALRARLDARLALAAFHSGGNERWCAERSEAAVDAARRSGEPRALAEALTARHTTAVLTVAPRERLELCAELRDAALRTGNAETLANTYAEQVVDRLAAGDLAEARADLSRFEGHVAATGSATVRWRLAVLEATFALADGRFDEGDALSGRALELGTELNQDDAEFAWAAQTFVSTWCRFGAGPVLGAAAELSQRHPETPAWAVVHALALADSGSVDDARRALAPVAADAYAAVPRDLLWMSAIMTAAETVLLCGDEAGARALIDLLLPYTGQLAIVGAGVAVLGPVDRVLGRLHGLAGHPGDAERHLRIALDVAGGFPPWRALALLSRAQFAGAGAGGADAAAAARIAAELGMVRIADAAEALAPSRP